MSYPISDNPTPEELEAYEDSLSPHLEPEIAEFIEEFIDAWETMGGKRMPGRVLGLLMMSDEPFMSAQRIGDLLEVSSGAVSMATRDLADVGYISRHHMPGIRRRFYKVHDDVWGAFLAGERHYLHRMSDVMQAGLKTAAGSRPGPATRLRNGHRYMTWLEQHHQNLLKAWQRYRDQEDLDD